MRTPDTLTNSGPQLADLACQRVDFCTADSPIANDNVMLFPNSSTPKRRVKRRQGLYGHDTISIFVGITWHNVWSLWAKISMLFK